MFLSACSIFSNQWNYKWFACCVTPCQQLSKVFDVAFSKSCLSMVTSVFICLPITAENLEGEKRVIKIKGERTLNTKPEQICFGETELFNSTCWFQHITCMICIKKFHQRHKPFLVCQTTMLYNTLHIIISKHYHMQMKY